MNNYNELCLNKNNDCALPSILLVDDKSENLLVLEKLLHTLGVKLIKAGNGNEALSVAVQEENLVLVLLDVNMPDMDGYEVLEIMHSDEKLKQIPVIFVTAYFRDEEHRLKGYELGAVDYLYKPIDRIILLSKVKTFIEIFKNRQENLTLQRQNQLILDSAGEGIFGLDENGYINFINPAAAQMLDREPKELLKKSLEVILPNTEINDGNYAWEDTEIYKASSAGYFHRVQDKILLKKDSENLPVDYVITSLRDERDKYLGAVVVFTDATQRICGEKTLQQLQQSQKMESIGQLTGGIAHDFNNILMTVQGNLELLSMTVPDGTAEKKRIDAALNGVHRGAALTRSLLAFARKQTLFPENINLATHLHDVVELLRPTIGEAITIYLTVKEDTDSIYVDLNQFENVLINLAINARDAMPEGGNIYIDAHNESLNEHVAIGKYQIAPGNYVKISFTDTGTGMKPEIIDHIFEPFFTTKEQGKGTGLGLSMIYGFITQSKGRITVYSELGHGTTFNLYFPRSIISSEKTNPQIVNLKQSFQGKETILVVEDETAVRDLVHEFLLNAGYTVLTANDGVQALEILKTEKTIDFLFSDIVMPGGISGSTLAKQAKEFFPNIKVLLTSGYPKIALENGNKISTEEHIMKPYKLDSLALKIREILNK